MNLHPFRTVLLFVGLSSTFLNAVPAQSPTRIQVGGNVQSAKLIHKVPPVYPRQAKEERRQGTVTLQAVILKDGSIGSLELMPGADSDLASAAMEAVRQWVYSQTLLNGDPVEVATTIQINFTLTK